MAKQPNEKNVFAEAQDAFDESMHKLKVELTTQKLRQINETQKAINFSQSVVDEQQKTVDKELAELKTKGVNV